MIVNPNKGKRLFAPLAMTTVHVVVDEAGGLQKGVADCGAEKFESAAFHVFAYGVRNSNSVLSSVTGRPHSSS